MTSLWKRFATTGKPTNILASGFRVKRTVYVLASGPNGTGHYGRIPEDAWVIAVNSAIHIQEAHKSIWLCADGTLPEKQWFDKAALELIACNYELRDARLPTPVFDGGVLLGAYPGVPYVFQHGRSLIKAPWGCERGVLRGGATISAQAVQLAYLMGSRKIILCGVDMRGDRYYDGTATDNNQISGDEQKWHARSAFNILVQWLLGEGVEIMSLSETALDVSRC